MVDTTIAVPAAAAPRAVARSPSAWARPWKAHGPTMIGMVSGAPRTSAAMETADTSRITRGIRRIRFQAAGLSARVVSSSAPPAK